MVQLEVEGKAAQGEVDSGPLGHQSIVVHVGVKLWPLDASESGRGGDVKAPRRGIWAEGLFEHSHKSLLG
jgi:hypothetical protein